MILQKGPTTDYNLETSVSSSLQKNNYCESLIKAIGVISLHRISKIAAKDWNISQSSLLVSSLTIKAVIIQKPVN